MTKICDFGKEIKKRLVDINQTQEWLISEVSQDTGKYFDSGYLHRILRGELSTPGIVASIRKILDLPNDTAQ
nr:MAG TPA: POU domain, class 6, transcription-DNA complex, Helix-turn-helix (HTH), DNA-binding.51A [Caudoviricetes sp.]